MSFLKYPALWLIKYKDEEALTPPHWHAGSPTALPPLQISGSSRSMRKKGHIKDLFKMSIPSSYKRLHSDMGDRSLNFKAYAEAQRYRRRESAALHISGRGFVGGLSSIFRIFMNVYESRNKLVSKFVKVWKRSSVGAKCAVQCSRLLWSKCDISRFQLNSTPKQYKRQRRGAILILITTRWWRGEVFQSGWS